MPKKSRTSSDDAAIDRKINRLLKSDSSSDSDQGSDNDEAQSELANSVKKRSRTGNSKESEKKRAFQLCDLDSESSDSENTISQTDRHPGINFAAQTIDPNEAARQQLLESSDTELSSDAEEANQGVEALLKEEVLSENNSPNMLEEVVTDPSENIKLERKEVRSEEIQDRKVKERERSLSPETAKLLRDPIEKGIKKASEAGEASPEAKKKLDKRKRRIVHSDSDSDFQSSGSNKEEKPKTKKKKAPSSDDDFEDEEANEHKPKRRRRIKKMESSDSEASEDDSDVQILNESQRSDGGAGNKGRKNIKKIIKDQNLKVSSTVTLQQLFNVMLLDFRMKQKQPPKKRKKERSVLQNVRSCTTRLSRETRRLRTLGLIN